MSSIFTRFKVFMNNLSIERKTFLSIFLTEFIFLIFSIFIVINLVTAKYDQLLFTSMNESSFLVAESFSQRLQELIDMSDVVRADDVVQTDLDAVQNYTPGFGANYYSEIYNVLQRYYLQYKQSYTVFCAIANPRFVTYTYGFIKDYPSDDTMTSLIDAANEADGSPRFVSNTEESSLFLVREIKKIQYTKLTNIGTFILKVDLDALLADVTKNNAALENSYWIIYDSDSIIYSSPALTDADAMSMHSLNSPYQILKMSDGQYFCVAGTTSVGGWHYVHGIPYSAILASKNQALIRYLLALILAQLGCFLVLHIVLRKTTRHFDILINRMKLFAEHTDLPIETNKYYEQRQDEIGQLHSQFQQMAQQIQLLVVDNYRQEILTQEAQLKSLEAQMNPHFLYNTLDSINWRAKAIGEDEISQIAESLGHFLRVTLNNRNTVFTLADELDIIHSYMTIQLLRFESRIDYSEHVPDHLLEAIVPKLSIQPLLENSIHYGVEQALDVCRITLSAVLHEGNLHIYVKNSDSEFPEDFNETLKAGKIEGNGLGIALCNIVERIQLSFGNDYGIIFYNENDMAVAHLVIPFTSSKE